MVLLSFILGLCVWYNHFAQEMTAVLLLYLKKNWRDMIVRFWIAAKQISRESESWRKKSSVKWDMGLLWMQPVWQIFWRNYDAFDTAVHCQQACFDSGKRSSWFSCGFDSYIRVALSASEPQAESKILNFRYFVIISLRPSDTIWRHRSGSTLAQVMACCLTAPNHYLNQCWLIISKVYWYSSEGNFIRDTSATIH